MKQQMATDLGDTEMWCVEYLHRQFGITFKTHETATQESAMEVARGIDRLSRHKVLRLLGPHGVVVELG
jgi:hypothetical protein